MSDTPQGEGWWQAADGKWYPPEDAPDATAPSAPPAAGATVGPSGAPPAGSTPADAPPPAAATSGSGSGGNRKVLIGVIAVIVLAAAAFAAFTFLGDDEASASEVTLEPIGTSGTDAYTASVAPAPSASLADFADSGPPEGAQLADFQSDDDTGYRSVDGGVPGVFGGTLDEFACDPDQLVSFLEAEPEKAATWAAVLEIDASDIASYVDGLTPTNLTVDTRVLSHSYADGEANPRESLLQRGTAVFVDSRGVPRVNCYSGNPLREPEVVRDESFVGDRWSSLEETEIVVVQAAPAPVTEFELLDYETGERFTRPAGRAQEAGDEPDDSATEDLPSEVEIEPGTPVTDEISEARPEVLYTIDIPDSAVVTLRVANERESINRILLQFGTPGSQVDSFRVAPGDDDERTYVLAADEGGTYELLVNEGPAAYELEVAVEVQDDGGSGGDAGDDVTTAVELASGDAVEGLLGGSDRLDQYSLELEPGTELRLVAANPRTSEARFLLQMESEGSQLFSERVSPGGDTEFSVLLGPEDDGFLDITVQEGPADYTFTIELVEQADGGEPGDAGNDLATARELTDASDVTGEVGNRDDADVYLFEAPGVALEITATVGVDRERALFQVIGPDGGQEASFRVSPGATESAQFEAEPGEQYQLVVREGRAQYQVTIGEPGLVPDAEG